MGQQLTFNLMLPYVLILSFISLISSYPSSSNHHNPNYDQSSTSPVNAHAILIAGTSGWFNYRHQANIAHGYQILRSHGIPEENIIVMSVDDIARSDENPMKGKLFNSPAGGDVYSGLKVDYSGNQVTPINFLNILKGLPTRTLPKVLKSGPDDIVFIYISSLGSTGLIGFPNDILTSTIFNQALIDLKSDRKFSHLIVYLDSDYSGSIFTSMLPDNISVYSVSSAFDQINVAYYCNDLKIPFTCLADSYSTAVLSNLGSQPILIGKTVSQQFKSIVQSLFHSLPSIAGQYFYSNGNEKTLITNQLSTFDVPLEMTKAKVQVTFDEEPLLDMVNSRKSFDQAFYRLINDLCWAGYCSNATKVMSSSNQLTNHPIYHSIVTKFQTDCLNIARASYAMSKMYAFANIITESEAKLSQQLDKFLQSLYQSCRRRIINHRFEDII